MFIREALTVERFKKSVVTLVAANSKEGENADRLRYTSFNKEPRSVLVISDTHFGADGCSKEAFGRFLDWLADWMNASTTGGATSDKASQVKEDTLEKGEGQKTEPEPPELVILLGDFLEYWDPRGDDRTQPLRDSFQIFDKLFNLPCKKVYVIGNHDHEMVEYGSISALRAHGRAKPSSGVYPCTNATQFVIARDHYPNLPSNRTDEWLRIGDRYYYFLHGHQLDKWFKAVGELKFVPGWMSQFASAYRSINPWFGRIFSVILFLTVAAGVGSALGLWAAPLGILLLLTVASIWVAAPWLWVKLQRPVWKWIARRGVVPKFVDVERVARDYFRPDKLKTRARTLVFGHTHYPGCWRDKDGSLKGWTFVNSGSWLKPSSDILRKHPDIEFNTFVYIDEKGPSLCQWVDDKRTVTTLKGPFIAQFNV
jgi:UDP-2,3-diacylglucosamine pyrophosphatase LpxH